MKKKERALGQAMAGESPAVLYVSAGADRCHNTGERTKRAGGAGGGKTAGEDGKDRRPAPNLAGGQRAIAEQNFKRLGGLPTNVENRFFKEIKAIPGQ